jgi:hypothetical protein
MRIGLRSPVAVTFTMDLAISSVIGSFRLGMSKSIRAPRAAVPELALMEPSAPELALMEPSEPGQASARVF